MTTPHHSERSAAQEPSQALGEHIGREAMRPALPADVPRPDVEGIRVKSLASKGAVGCRADTLALCDYVLDLEAEIRRHHRDFEALEEKLAEGVLKADALTAAYMLGYNEAKGRHEGAGQTLAEVKAALPEQEGGRTG